jgi:hypothetical protein
MPTPCAARGENEVRLQLPTPTTASDLAVVVADARAQDPQARIVLDCGGAAELPCRVVTELSRLRGELRQDGGDLVLLNCDASVRQALDNPPAASPLGGTFVRHAAHRLRGPHPAFLRAFRAGV